MSVKKLLTHVQQSSTKHFMYIKELEEIYKKTETNSFIEEFGKCLIIAFSKDYKVQNQFLNRFYNFCITFLHKIYKKADDLFTTKIFDIVLECLSNKSVNIRCNSYNFLYKYIQYLIKEEESVEKSLCNDIIVAVLDGLQDRQYFVRVKSATLLELLQNYITLSNHYMSSALVSKLNDTNGKVRAAIVSALSPTLENIPFIVKCCRDFSEHVRVNSYIKISNVVVQTFTIEQRQYVLKSGLRDRSIKVKKCLSNLVLPSWLNYYERDYLRFLKAIELDSDENEVEDTRITSKLVLQSLFCSQPTEEILEVLALENKLIPIDDLTWSSAIYWRSLISHLKNKNLDDQLELILPETVLFCNYIEEFCKESTLQNGTIWEQQHYLLILNELISILISCDISDEASRRKVQSLLVKMLKKTQIPEEIILEIVKYFDFLLPDVEERIHFFCELIADIRLPLESKISGVDVNENDEKKNVLQEILRNLIQAREEAVENQNFSEAQRLNEEINQTRGNLQLLTTELTEEIETKSNDPEIVLRCINIVYAMLQSENINKITSDLKSLKVEILKELMQFEDPIIRSKYLKCYGIICSLDSTIAEEHIQLFCLPLLLYKTDDKCEIEILTAAVACIGDLILLRGTNIFPVNDNFEDLESEIDFDLLYGQKKASLNEVIDIISLMMDDKNIEIREMSCTVLFKLLHAKRIESPKLFSRLFIKWLNPATAKDERLRQILGLFIESFCQLPNIELQLEESIIPTIQTIGLAPNSSPLSNLSKDAVLKNIIKILNLRNDEDYPIHENLALAICKEIMKDYKNPCNSFYVKTLLYLELYRENTEYIEDLLNICEDIRIELKDKILKKNMDKFIFSLKHE